MPSTASFVTQPTKVAGQTCDVQMGDYQLLVVPHTKRKFDITPFSPQVRTTSPRYNDFSLKQTWVMDSWHHGRGALEWNDPEAFFDSRGVDTRIQGQLLLCPLQNATVKSTGGSLAGNPVRFYLAQNAGNLYCCTGGASRQVWVWDNTNTYWTSTVAGLTADPTDMVEFLNALYVAQGEANNMRKYTGFATWGDGGQPANYLAAGAVGTANGSSMWRADNINELYYTVDGTNWQGPFYCGDTNTPIRSLLIWDNRLYAGKDDGLYVVQDGRVNQLLDFSFARDPNNFRWMRVWQGAIYFPIGSGLYRLIGGTTLQAVGPNRGAAGNVELANLRIDRDAGRTFHGLAAGRTGQVVDLIPTESFLYACIDGANTGDTSQIVAYNGLGWHNVVEGAAANNRIRGGFFTASLASTGSLANPRLWYGYGNDVYNIILPDNTEDPDEYTSQTYLAGGASVYLDSPQFDAGLAGVHKEWLDVTVVSENLTTTETVQIAYELDDIGTFQNLTDVNDAALAFSFSPTQTIPFPANSVSRRIRLRVLPVRGGTTTLSPKIKAIIVTFMVRPDPHFAWQLTGRTGLKLLNPYTHRVDPADPAEWLHRIEELRRTRSRFPFDDGDLEPGITNQVLNPEPRIDTNADTIPDNWAKVNGAETLSWSYLYKVVGIRSLKVVTGTTGSHGVDVQSLNSGTNGLTAGKRYTVSAWVYLVSGDNVSLGIDNGAGLWVGTPVTITPNTGLTRYEFTFTADATTGYIFRITRTAAAATQATTFYVNGAQFEENSDTRYARFDKQASRFCSGEQPGCFWTGRPHASTSYRKGVVNAVVSNIGAVEIKRPAFSERIRGRGNEHRITFTVTQVD